MKDERTHYGTVDNWTRSVSDSTLISFTVRKIGPTLPLLVVLMAGWQTKYTTGWISKVLEFLKYYFYYWCNVIIVL